MEKIEYYGAYYLGALLAVKKVIEMMDEVEWKHLEKPYREATLKLITKDKRSMQLYMDGCHEICYRNHVKDKKGKIKSCEAYFSDSEYARKKGGEDEVRKM